MADTPPSRRLTPLAVLSAPLQVVALGMLALCASRDPDDDDDRPWMPA